MVLNKSSYDWIADSTVRSSPFACCLERMSARSTGVVGTIAQTSTTCRFRIASTAYTGAVLLVRQHDLGPDGTGRHCTSGVGRSSRFQQQFQSLNSQGLPTDEFQLSFERWLNQLRQRTYGYCMPVTTTRRRRPWLLHVVRQLKPPEEAVAIQELRRHFVAPPIIQRLRHLLRKAMQSRA